MEHDGLNALLRELNRLDGSDLHLKAGSPPKVRVNGALLSVHGTEVLTDAATAEIAAAIVPDRVAEEFETTNEADFSYEGDDVGRYRVNAFRQRGSVALVMRRISADVATADVLGLPDVVVKLAEHHRGLILVCGPTGSGKTTTLAAMIDHINETRDASIITLEDPIEVLHPDKRCSVNQREIGIDTLDLKRAMRAAMRQDPDVILVGEMRDEATVSAALSAAETGHLVLSTLHTIDATETVNRIVDFFSPHQQHQVRHQLAGALVGAVCQRLVPTSDGHGRCASLEVLVNNGRVAQCIVDPGLTATLPEIIAEGSYYGMRTFDQSLVELFADGRVSLTAAVAASSKPHDMKVLMQREGLIDSDGRPTRPSAEEAEEGRALLSQVLNLGGTTT